ncbi:MAG: hypothetical protein LBS92_02090 [Candidatus Methanoplasma sp.]|jgi:hypothetical protein|nr:hypothetical protein [Candidatus Methanoplasma sp.]
MTGEEQTPTNRRLSSRRAVAAIAVVAILAIAAVAGYFIVLNGNHATADITVQSNHPLADLDVTVYVDGKDVGTWHVNGQNSAHISYDYSWSVFDDAKTIEVKAVYLGVQGDAQTITVCKGGVNNVTLLLDPQSCHTQVTADAPA